LRRDLWIVGREQKAIWRFNDVAEVAALSLPRPSDVRACERVGKIAD
jgi:hypothetical protein